MSDNRVMVFLVQSVCRDGPPYPQCYTIHPSASESSSQAVSNLFKIVSLLDRPCSFPDTLFDWLYHLPDSILLTPRVYHRIPVIVAFDDRKLVQRCKIQNAYAIWCDTNYVLLLFTSGRVLDVQF